jgi:hypothetical protein
MTTADIAGKAIMEETPSVTTDCCLCVTGQSKVQSDILDGHAFKIVEMMPTDPPGNYLILPWA